MGKSALLLVAAFSMAGARLLYTSQETDVKSSQQQSEYDADLIAREIARSAYNAAVSDANIHGSDVPAALAAVGTLVVSANQTRGNECANRVPTCYRREGVMQGGTYRVEASVTGGNGVDIYSRGTYDYSGVQSAAGNTNRGRMVRLVKSHEINEMRSVGVLQVARSGKLQIQFIDSSAGYCSAIFLKRTIPGLPEASQPLPEMVYAPGHNRNGDRNVGYETILAPGTQMNFGIGVDMNCGSGGTRPNSMQALRKTEAANLLTAQGPAALSTLMASYRPTAAVFASDWNHIHWALDAGSLQNGDPQEGPWALVESDVDNNQRWRIGFEDIRNWNLASTDARYNQPRYSLWATKRFGYDQNNDGRGDGWADALRTVVTPERVNGRETGRYRISEVAGQDGFHDLLDSGSWPDFSDQVIMVQITPLTDADVPA